MLKNQRPYQLMQHKTNNKIISVLVAVGAKAVGIAACLLLSIFKKNHLEERPVTELVDKAEAVFKKPNSTQKEEWALTPESDGIGVSIIVPAHNAGAYLKECMDSIIGQTPFCRIQIIAVDDGSEDNTPEILNGYKDKAGVICIRNEKASGAAGARNTGLKYASEKYVMFVDSDDMLFPGAVNALLSKAERSGADIVQGGWQYISENGVYGCVQTYANHTYVGKTESERFDLPGMPWGKIYKRSLFEKICFPKGYSCFEDAIIHFLVFRSAKQVVSVEQKVYAWRKNMSGLTAHSQNKPKALQAYWIMEDLLLEDKRLNLPHDDMFVRSLTMQLSNYCFACVSGMEESTKQMIFLLCSELYSKYCPPKVKRMPYAIDLAHKALKRRDFGLWQLQGKFFSLIR